MKTLTLLAFILLSSSAFAVETLKGKFSLDNTEYELAYSYDMSSNQVASTQRVRILDDVILPEQVEPMPAFCMFEMTFPLSYQVKIKNMATQEIVYSKGGTEYVSTSIYGGLVEAKECEWNVSKWKAKTPGMLRITDWSFDLNGKSYRYFMDTYLAIDAQGNNDNLVVAKSSAPTKGGGGQYDGEAWFDTQPTSDGNYQRIWLPLSL